MYVVPRDWFETNLWHQKRYSEGGKKIVGVVVYWEEQYNFPKTKDFQQIEQLDLHRSVVPWKSEKLAKNK